MIGATRAGFATLFFGGLLVAAFLMALRNWREYRRGRKMGLLYGVSDEELQNIPHEWPLNEDRWPLPSEIVSGLNDERDFSSALPLRIYAKLAKRNAALRRLCANVSGIVGSAWLGAIMPSFWRLFRDELNKSNDRPVEDQGGLLSIAEALTSPSMWTLLPPAGLVGVAAILLYSAERYDDAFAEYNAVRGR